MSHSLEQIIEVALDIQRTAANEDEYWEIWPIIMEARGFGQQTFDSALDLLKGDVAERCVGCDLLNTLCNPDEENWSHRAAEAIVEMANGESDEDVCASIAQALRFTRDPIAIPVLLRMSSHDDEDVRFHVANALPSCCDAENQNDPNVVGALMALMNDSCTQVRDWATFGLAQQLEADSREIRVAFSKRLDDSDPDTRREALIGLARRRDTRAIEPTLSALRDGDNDLLVLESAQYLADERFHPYLMQLNSDIDVWGEQIVRARRVCDPLEIAFARTTMLEFLAALDEALQHDEMDVRVGLVIQRFQIGTYLEIESRHSEDESWWWSFEDLLDRSEHSVSVAVSNVLADIRKKD